MIDRNHIQKVFRDCWSKQSSSKWTITNPASGQCSVTALVLHHFFGGLILKTEVTGRWHFYNIIKDEFYDFTAEQFETPIDYHGVESSPEEALADTTPEHYRFLLGKVESLLLKSI